jgi:hypothetical protein
MRFTECAAASGSGDASGDFAASAMGDASGTYTAVSATGDTRSCTGGLNCASLSGTGDATGGTAASLMGNASGAYVAISATGNASCEEDPCIAVSGRDLLGAHADPAPPERG